MRSSVTLATFAMAVSIAILPPIRASADQEAALPVNRAVVMPFATPEGDRRSLWLGEGAAVMLTDSLSALGVPVMRRPERLRWFERLRVPTTTNLTRATVIRVAEAVGAAEVVLGSIDVVDGVLTVRARSILVDSGELSTEVVEKGPLDELVGVFDRVAQRLVPGASVPAAQLADSHPPLAAFEQYVKGLLASAPAVKLRLLGEALRLAPSLQRARIAIWDVQRSLGEHERALTEVQRVPAGHRLGRQAGLLASISLIELKRYQEAFERLTELNRLEPDAAVLNDLGIVQLRRPSGGPGGRAVFYFNQAAGLGAVEAFFNLGYAYWVDGDAAAAAYWLGEAIRRNPADHAAHYVLAAALSALGRSSEAARERDLAKQLTTVYEDWESRSPDRKVPSGLERLTMEVGPLDEPGPEAGAADQESPERAGLHLEAARRAYDSEHDRAAAAELGRALFLSPYDATAQLLLGRVYLRSGRQSDAIDAFRISIWSSDTDDARLALADALARAGATDEARAVLQVVIERHPENAQADRLLDRLLER